MKCAQKRTNVSYGNPIIGDIETAKYHKAHRDAINRCKASIDNKPPAPMPHLQLYGRDYFAKKKATTEAAFQDLKMIQSIAKTMTRPYVVPSAKGPVSLNASFRKKELFRITMDNHRLLERLENLTPELSLAEMEKEHIQRQGYMVNSSSSARKGGQYDDFIAKHMTVKSTNENPLLKRNMSVPAASRTQQIEDEGEQNAAPVKKAPAPAPAPKKADKEEPKAAPTKADKEEPKAAPLDDAPAQSVGEVATAGQHNTEKPSSSSEEQSATEAEATKAPEPEPVKAEEPAPAKAEEPAPVVEEPPAPAPVAEEPVVEETPAPAPVAEEAKSPEKDEYAEDAFEEEPVAEEPAAAEAAPVAEAEAPAAAEPAAEAAHNQDAPSSSSAEEAEATAPAPVVEEVKEEPAPVVEESVAEEVKEEAPAAEEVKEEPAPVVEEPAAEVVADEAPAAAAEEPVPVVEEEAAPVVEETPAPVVEEGAAPVVEEAAAPEATE